MPAYLIVTRESPLRDADAYAEYQRLNRQGSYPARPTPLVAYGALQPLEGEAPDGVVMLRFDTPADARAWYDSPSYQEALQHRLKAADWRAFIVEGL